jgi:hypothetical protein
MGGSQIIAIGVHWEEGLSELGEATEIWEWYVCLAVTSWHFELAFMPTLKYNAQRMFILLSFHEARGLHLDHLLLINALNPFQRKSNHLSRMLFVEVDAFGLCENILRFDDSKRVPVEG